MAQSQQIVNLHLLEGKIGNATANGNNAAWACPCGRDFPLLGHTCSSGLGENDRVDCPDCGRRFFVLGDGARFSKAQEVKEIAAN